MNQALFRKAVREGWWLFAGSAVLLLIFCWVNVWIVSQFKVAHMQFLLNIAKEALAAFFDVLVPVPIEFAIQPVGRIAMAFDHPLVLLLISAWAISRGSDVVSGEVNRGTMEILLAQPVRRLEVLLSHVAVTLIGLTLLCCTCWIGLCLGVATVELSQNVDPRLFVPATLNLFAMGFFLAGLTTMLSAADQYRSRTVGIVVGFFATQILIKLIVGWVSWLGWMRWLTFLTAFEPQKLSHSFWDGAGEAAASEAVPMLIGYVTVLGGLGIIFYFIAGLLFCRRDLPAPL